MSKPSVLRLLVEITGWPENWIIREFEMDFPNKDIESIDSADLKKWALLLLQRHFHPEHHFKQSIN